MRRVLSLVALLFIATPLSAQRVTLGAEAALMDYREQGAALRFSGAGVSGRAVLSVWRLQVQGRVARVHVDGASDNADHTDAFDIAQYVFRIGFHLTSRF